MEKVIVIVGPTASGKSSLGVFIAKKVGGEIISADSRQVYRGLNIGTGKITKKEMENIPHHLLDVASPKQIFTASDFMRQGDKAIADIVARGHTPLVVGGTGLYVDVLMGRMSFPDVPPNTRLRTQLEKKSVKQLLAMLKRKDPRRAKTVEVGNKRRLIRALEIASAVGKSPLRKQTPRYDVLWLGLNPSIEKLHTNIHRRLEARLKQGMVAEARHLHTKGLSYKRMEALGLEYRYLSGLLQKKISRQEMSVYLERDIKKYAKRQMRWFRYNTDIVNIKNKTQALLLVRKFLLNR